MKSEKKYYMKLNIVRDISCILVLLYHLNIVKGGFLAVCTFFTLSGYLSCMSAIKNKNFSIKAYYLNRIIKLYLPLIMVVFITVILSKIIPNINWINLKPETMSVVLGYNNFWRLNANLDYFTRNVNSPFIHLWYISILLQFDLVFPIVVSAIKKANNKGKKYSSIVFVSLLTIITTLLFINMSKTQNIMVVYYNTFARSFSILFGVLLGLIHYKCNFKISNILENFNTYIFIIYCFAITFICIFMPEETNNYAFYMILITIITTRLIEYSTNEKEINTEFNRIINGLSNISYEVYLVQYPIIFFMQNANINEGLKVFFIFILTFIFAVILHLLTKKSSKNILLKSVKTIFIIVTIAFGSFVVITEKNYSTEMKDLENRLNENSKIIEEKNKEFLNNETQNNNKIKEKSNQDNSNKDNSKKENKIHNEESSNNIIETNKKETNEATEGIDIDEKIKKMQIVGVGDSVMLDAIKEFYNQFPNGYFDGKISRSISGAEDVLKNLKNKGKLGNIVILSLATNGDYSDKKNKKLMELLGDREIYWVDSAGPDDPKFNEKFEKFAENYPNIHIVGWKKFAKEHPEYLEPDKIHPNYKGGKVLVKLIYDAIYSNISKEKLF